MNQNNDKLEDFSKLDVEKHTARFIKQFTEELNKADSHDHYYELVISKMVSYNIIIGDFLANSNTNVEELDNLMNTLEKISEHITQIYITKYLSKTSSKIELN